MNRHESTFEVQYTQYLFRVTTSQGASDIFRLNFIVFLTKDNACSRFIAHPFSSSWSPRRLRTRPRAGRRLWRRRRRRRSHPRRISRTSTLQSETALSSWCAACTLGQRPEIKNCRLVDKTSNKILEVTKGSNGNHYFQKTLDIAWCYPSWCSLTIFTHSLDLTRIYNFCHSDSQLSPYWGPRRILPPRRSRSTRTPPYWRCRLPVRRAWRIIEI